jgi:squalene-hopene/tetraprenyl-beta-curcumene cyclase
LGDGGSSDAAEVRKTVEFQLRNSRGSLFTTIPLALNDAAAGSGLQPFVRSRLDDLMNKQGVDGGWHGANTFTPPFEAGDYYPNVMAAVAIGNAPDQYATTEKGAAGMAKLVQYLKRVAPENLHDRALLLWASMSTPALMDEGRKNATLNELLSKQRADGGWSFASLGNWSRHDGTRNDPGNSPSDGYGTGLITYVLLKAGVPAQSSALMRAVDWLRTHQRISGRWFTPSLNYDDGINIMTNSGTIYAMMALHAAGVGGGAESDSTQ